MCHFALIAGDLCPRIVSYPSDYVVAQGDFQIKLQCNYDPTYTTKYTNLIK